MINITNYSDHPTRMGFTIFRFNNKQRAEYFETLLKQDGIWHEASIEEDNSIYLFGVKKGDFKKAMHANYLVSAKYRSRTIPNKYIGLAILVVVFAAITLAIFGAIKT